MNSSVYLAAAEFLLVAGLFLALAQSARARRLSSVFLPQRANVTAARRRNRSMMGADRD